MQKSKVDMSFSTNSHNYGQLQEIDRPFSEDVLLETVDSTQTYARREYKRQYYNQITFIRALHQTEGRGQFDRKWECQSKKNILTTIIFPFFTRIEQLKNVTSVVGYTIVKLYKELYNLNAQLKWMNDILINCQKSVGILVESEQIDNKYVLFVGIGINVNWCTQGATSLKENLGKEVDQNQLYLLLKERVIKALYDLNDFGFEYLRVRMNKILYKRGQLCEFVDSKTLQKVYSGILEGLNEQGDLVIRDKVNYQRAIVGLNVRLKV
ncbi:unnamed protein product (macronuclear) [Paramecium tetraurelia]|uniref:BPL/LPL catalytic domain-containing protein n=1 Tax=Paramecium tetraurelia TaxID=5888 RepID=A0EBS5_PARTE|nr:uncharacterized protein GSPATT00025476001 [Paramecium tetraurelia]CAK92742.1 unnamed protein product [Paramecium tetraurelia]|eukprot:XP_001460139.1 hypothetical protein (macronuclear) [Paramecium tetraurelia strain d4-2]